nr:hypothetical protein RVX_1429 [Nitratidesulfovibrio sp. HK-II]
MFTVGPPLTLPSRDAGLRGVCARLRHPNGSPAAPERRAAFMPIFMDIGKGYAPVHIISFVGGTITIKSWARAAGVWRSCCGDVVRQCAAGLHAARRRYMVRRQNDGTSPRRRKQ